MNKTPALTPWLRDRNRLIFILALLAVAGVFFLLAVNGGHKLLVSGHLWPDNIIFGFDNARNIESLSKPGANDRSNVHPLFAPMFKPFGLLVERAGVTPGTAAIVVNAGFGALGLLLTAGYLRARRVGRLDAWLAVLLMASSTTFIFQSALPNTFIFSLCVIALSNLLMIRTWWQPDGTLRPAARVGREALWIVLGVVNYGITVTNGFMSFVNYGFARRETPSKKYAGWLRAGVYGAIVLTLGLLLTWLAGSLFNAWSETQWVTDEKMRRGVLHHPFLHSLSTSLFWGFVAPIPRVTYSMPGSALPIASFHDWHYTAGGWLLLVGWLAIVMMAAVALGRDRDVESRRFSLVLLICLLFHVTLHSFYNTPYEGVFIFNGHSLFLMIGLLAPLLTGVPAWPVGSRRVFRAGLLVLALILARRHYHLLLEMRKLIPLP